MQKYARTRSLLAPLLTVLVGAGAASASEAAAFRIYVSNEKSNDVTVIDGITHQVLATVAVGKRPRGLHVSRDGATVYVALSGSPITGPPAAAGVKGIPAHDDDEAASKADKSADGIGVIDARRLIFSHKFAVGSDPEQFALADDGKHLYIANEDVATASIIDLASEKVVQLVAVGKEPEGVAISPNGAFFYVTCEATGDLFAVSRTDSSILAHLTIGGRPRSVAFTLDGAKAFVASETNASVYVLDTARQVVTRVIKLEGGETMRPMGSLMSMDGKKVYISTGRGGRVAVIDSAQETLLTTIAVGPRPWGLAQSPDGTQLLVANGPSNDISLVDLVTEKETARIKVGQSPWGIAVGPAFK